MYKYSPHIRLYIIFRFSFQLKNFKSVPAMEMLFYFWLKRQGNKARSFFSFFLPAEKGEVRLKYFPVPFCKTTLTNQ